MVSAAMLSVVATVVVFLLPLSFAAGRRYKDYVEQEADVDENADQLDELDADINEVKSVLRVLSETTSQIKRELEENRRDIHYQHKLVHDQLLDGSEQCGNPQCPFCHPENLSRDVDLGADFPDAVESSFEDWDVRQNDD